MKNVDQLPFGFRLPELSDEVAVEIHNFLQIVIQIYESQSTGKDMEQSALRLTFLAPMRHQRRIAEVFQ